MICDLIRFYKWTGVHWFHKWNIIGGKRILLALSVVLHIAQGIREALFVFLFFLSHYLGASLLCIQDICVWNWLSESTFNKKRKNNPAHLVSHCIEIKLCSRNFHYLLTEPTDVFKVVLFFWGFFRPWIQIYSLRIFHPPLLTFSLR